MNRTVVLCRHDRIKTLAQLRYCGFRKLRTAQFFRNLCHFAGRHPVNHHLHQGQHQSLFAALVTGKQLRRELMLD